jgi:hypothetical protein
MDPNASTYSRAIGTQTCRSGGLMLVMRPFPRVRFALVPRMTWAMLALALASSLTQTEVEGNKEVQRTDAQAHERPIFFSYQLARHTTSSTHELYTETHARTSTPLVHASTTRSDDRMARPRPRFIPTRSTRPSSMDSDTPATLANSLDVAIDQRLNSS